LLSICVQLKNERQNYMKYDWRLQYNLRSTRIWNLKVWLAFGKLSPLLRPEMKTFYVNSALAEPELGNCTPPFRVTWKKSSAAEGPNDFILRSEGHKKKSKEDLSSPSLTKIFKICIFYVKRAHFWWVVDLL